MKSLNTSVGILFILFSTSCRKESTVLTQTTSVKSYPADYDIYLLNSFQLDDGHYILASSDYLNVSSGQLLKVDASGKKIWDKPLSSQILFLWRAIPVPGKGFLAFGIKDINANAMYLCLYDNDGNLISTDSIVTTLPNFGKTPYNIIRLSNGNYAMVGGTAVYWFDHYIYVRILSADFKTLANYQFSSPDANKTNICRAVSELPDASLQIVATVCKEFGEIKNLLFLKMNLNGGFISSRYFKDTVNSESANEILPYNGGMFAVTAKMHGISFGFDIADNSNNGIAVNYDNSYGLNGSLISGRIYFRKYDNAAQPVDSTEIKDYPLNGMINSVRKTNDGGYILCGTVNQQSTTLFVSVTRIYLLKLDANLQVMWSKIIPSTYPAIGNDALPTPDGGYLVTGLHKTYNKRCEALVIKTDANGNF